MTERKTSNRNRKRRKPPIFIEPYEAKRLLDILSAEPPKFVSHGALRNVALVSLALYGGLRVHELHQLDRRDVNLTAGYVTVTRGKGGVERTVALPPPAVRALRAYFEARTDDDPAAFMSRRGGRLARTTMQGIVRRYTARAGIIRNGRPVSIHKLRHTFATWLAQDDVHPVKIQQMLGHSSLSTTMVYMHAAGSHDDVAGLDVDKRLARRRR